MIRMRHRYSLLWLNKFLTKIFLPALLLISFSARIALADVSPAAGEKIFTNNCKSCHKAAPFDAPLVGPPLKDIQKKESEEWLLKWIRNNAALRSSGDK